MIAFQLQQLHESAIEPKRGTELSLGLDLHALVVSEDLRPLKAILPPRTTRVFRTGWAILPPQPDMRATAAHAEVWLPAVCSRSGLAKRSIFVANGVGIIDPDYRGEICVLLYNGGQETYYVEHGDRIGQLIAVQASLSTVEIIDAVPQDTTRGADGHGSTGR